MAANLRGTHDQVSAVCLIALLAGFANQASAQDKQTLRLVQTIPLPGVTGRLDHMGVDLEKKRLFDAIQSGIVIVHAAGQSSPAVRDESRLWRCG
jgi:hypothetical protein